MSNEATKSFRKNIARIKINGESLASLTHDTAVAMAYHAHEHGDMTLFVDLFNALHTAQRRKGFLVWLHDHTPIRIRVKDDVAMAKGSGIQKETDKTFTPWNLDGLRSVTYWDYTKERDPKLLDAAAFERAIEALAKRLERAIEKEQVSPDLDIEAASAYLARLAAIEPGNLKVSAARAN